MKTMKIVEKDVRKSAAGDLVVEVYELVKRSSGGEVFVSLDRYFVLVDEPGKEESDAEMNKIDELGRRCPAGGGK